MTTTRIQYSRDRLREIEKAVLANPKKFLPKQQRPSPEPEGRRARFERPPGYQGRVGRDRDAETFEEGYLYEMNIRQQTATTTTTGPLTGGGSHAAVAAAAGATTGGAALATEKNPSAAPKFDHSHSNKHTSEPAIKATAPPSAVVELANDFDDIELPVTTTRKSRFTFAADAKPQPTAAPVVAPPTAPPSSGVSNTVPAAAPAVLQPSSYSHAPVVSERVPRSQYQPNQASTANHNHSQGSAPLGSFTVSTAAAAPARQKPSGELDVVAALQRQGVNTSAHQGGGAQPQPPVTQGRVNRATPYDPNQGRQVSSVAPPDPAIVSYSPSSAHTSTATPAALQALFNASASRASVPQTNAAIDASALEAMLASQQPQQGRQGGYGGGQGGHRGGRRR